MPVRRVGVVVHGGREAAVAAARTVHRWCAERGIPSVDIDVWSAEHARRGSHEEAVAAGRPDLVVTLGGDGTFLRGARVAGACEAAVLGVDLGRVGFLTEVPADEVERALQAVHQGEALVEERMMLTLRASRPLETPSGMEALLRYGRGPALPPPGVRPGEPEDPADPAGLDWGVPLDVTAVNDVVFEKLARDRQASLAVYIAGRLLASYSADAVIASTPTGSTAYSFAAGGPVVSPHMDAVLFTPVAPHMAFDRSLVAAPDEPVLVRVLPRSGQVAVSIDGQLRGVLDPGDWVAVYAALRRLRLIRLGPTDFYGRLRDRFQLADAPAAAADGPAPAFVRPTAPVPADLARLRITPQPPQPPRQ
ncbi:NAD(+)/NADH kinase [Peterkaempfera griseoplana]|uniref:NAD(+)/NADH kinase n=1 Tax=Peterkaempfera griseoplana TaxID=66896 RepID=UPI0006E18D02|nr:NAD(+)/NADH kinase [Peterkaempfera griseoplana]